MSPRVPEDRRKSLGSAVSTLMGIWRLGPLLYAGQHSQLFTAQPADAEGSPRFDYVLRTVSEAGPYRVPAMEQLVRFATAASVAKHPNLVAVLDTSLQSAQPFLIMPRLAGVTLSRWMLAETVQPLPVVLWAMRQAAQALTALHAASWVHGDIKPDNLLISQQGHLTVLDLGFARQIGTATGLEFLGTPDYAAPEVMRSELTVAASDVYALGKILFKLLTWTAPTVRNQSLMEPVADLISAMLTDDHASRPSAQHVASGLLRLEIETLGEHIQPAATASRRAA